ELALLAVLISCEKLNGRGSVSTSAVLLAERFANRDRCAADAEPLSTITICVAAREAAVTLATARASIAGLFLLGIRTETEGAGSGIEQWTRRALGGSDAFE